MTLSLRRLAEPPPLLTSPHKEERDALCLQKQMGESGSRQRGEGMRTAPSMEIPTAVDAPVGRGAEIRGFRREGEAALP